MPSHLVEASGLKGGILADRVGRIALTIIVGILTLAPLVGLVSYAYLKWAGV